MGRGICCFARTMRDTVGMTEFSRLALLKSAVYEMKQFLKIFLLHQAD